MAHGILLQDWVTLKGATGSTQVVQALGEYADLDGFKDLVVFLEVSDLVNPCNLNFETAPAGDDVLFKAMTPTFAPSLGVTVTPLRYATAALPLARFFRWRISGAAGGAWSITFRIWLSANESRNARRMRVAQKARRTGNKARARKELEAIVRQAHAAGARAGSAGGVGKKVGCSKGSGCCEDCGSDGPSPANPAPAPGSSFGLTGGPPDRPGLLASSAAMVEQAAQPLAARVPEAAGYRVLEGPGPEPGPGPGGGGTCAHDPCALDCPPACNCPGQPECGDLGDFFDGIGRAVGDLIDDIGDFFGGGGDGGGGGGGSKPRWTAEDMLKMMEEAASHWGKGSNEHHISEQGVREWCQIHPYDAGCYPIEAGQDDQYAFCMLTPDWPGCANELKYGNHHDKLGDYPNQGKWPGHGADYVDWCHDVGIAAGAEECLEYSKGGHSHGQDFSYFDWCQRVGVDAGSKECLEYPKSGSVGGIPFSYYTWCREVGYLSPKWAEDCSNELTYGSPGDGSRPGDGKKRAGEWLAGALGDEGGDAGWKKLPSPRRNGAFGIVSEDKASSAVRPQPCQECTDVLVLPDKGVGALTGCAGDSCFYEFWDGSICTVLLARSEYRCESAAIVNDCYWREESGKCLSREGRCIRSGGRCPAKATKETCKCVKN